MTVKSSHLFEPLTLRDIILPNRIAMSPMCQYSAVDGLPNNWHLVHLGARATGGVGLVITEASAVEPRGRISPGDTGLWNDEQMAAWQPITRFIRQQGSVPGIQLAHAGRKASTSVPWEGSAPIPPGEVGWQPVAPSPLPFSEKHTTPHELTGEELDEQVDLWTAAAVRADRAGFDVIELHMAHGYLLHSFLSPITNQRADEHGGSLENRMRFPLRITQAVRKVWPENKPLLVRISSTDWHEEGWTVEDSAVFVQELIALGVDLVDCSSGGIQGGSGAPGDQMLAQVKNAIELKQETGARIGAVGGIVDARQAQELLEKGGIDLVLLGRVLLRAPQWPLVAAHLLNVDLPWPDQYARAKPNS